jgi:hypothetical protein
VGWPSSARHVPVCALLVGRFRLFGSPTGAAGNPISKLFRLRLPVPVPQNAESVATPVASVAAAWGLGDCSLEQDLHRISKLGCDEAALCYRSARCRGWLTIFLASDRTPAHCGFSLLCPGTKSAGDSMERNGGPTLLPRPQDPGEPPACRAASPQHTASRVHMPHWVSPEPGSLELFTQTPPPAAASPDKPPALPSIPTKVLYTVVFIDSVRVALYGNNAMPPFERVAISSPIWQRDLSSPCVR